MAARLKLSETPLKRALLPKMSVAFSARAVKALEDLPELSRDITWPVVLWYLFFVTLPATPPQDFVDALYVHLPHDAFFRELRDLALEHEWGSDPFYLDLALACHGKIPDDDGSLGFLVD